VIEKITISKNEYGVNIHQIPSAPPFEPIPSAPPFEPIPSAPPFEPIPSAPLIPNVAQYRREQARREIEQLRQQLQDDFNQRQLQNAQIDHKWKVRQRINAIIIGISWILFMVLFIVFGAQNIHDIKAYVMLGIASGCLILGFIIHGVMNCRQINEKVY
jgi:hypothetical protein